MQNVSSEYILATKQYTRTTLTSYVFTLNDGTSFTIDENSTKGNCTISTQCVDGNGFNLGSACIGEVSFSIDSNSCDENTLLGSTVLVKHGIYTQNGFEWLNMGVFTVTKATKSGSFISISGSDNIKRFDKSFYDSDDYNNRVNTIVVGLSNLNTLYNHLLFLCNSCNATLGQTQEEIQALELYETGQSNLFRIENGTITASPRDFLSYIAQLLGGFAYADYNGYIKIKRFGTSAIYDIGYPQVATDGLQESKFKMQLYGGYYQDEDNSWCKVWYPAYEGLANSIIVDASNNLFLQAYYQDNDLPMDCVGNICLAVGSISYIPYDISIIGNPALELGDCITIFDKHGNSFISVITNISWQSRGMQSLKCVGEDTRTLGSNIRNQTTRLAETTQKKINDIKGIDIKEEDFKNLDISTIKEGQTVYVY